MTNFEAPIIKACEFMTVLNFSKNKKICMEKVVEEHFP